MNFKRFLFFFFNIVFISRLGSANFYSNVSIPKRNFISRSNYQYEENYGRYNDPLMMGGQHVHIENYPYVVQVFKRSFGYDWQLTWDFKCTGVILERKVIIVSGLCLQSNERDQFAKDIVEYAILPGETVCEKSRKILDSSYVGVETIYWHPLAIRSPQSGEDMEYHVALLKLKEDLDFEGSNGKIGKIKICVRDVAYLAEIWEYVTGEVVGWGWTTEKTCCGISDQLLATHQDVITNYECRRRLDQRLTGPFVRQQAIPHCTVFCTDDTKITTDDRAYLCKTDTGVPFIVNNTLYGIATWFMAECSVFPDQKKTRIVMYNRLSCYGLYSWITETIMKITNKLL